MHQILQSKTGGLTFPICCTFMDSQILITDTLSNNVNIHISIQIKCTFIIICEQYAYIKQVHLNIVITSGLIHTSVVYNTKCILL